MRFVWKATVTRRVSRPPARAAPALQAAGIGLPVIALLGFVLSLWIYAVPRFEDLERLRGEVQHVEIVRPRRGRPFGRVTLGDRQVVFVRWLSAVRGGARRLAALRPGEPVTAWIEPHELQWPGQHVTWQLHSGREVLFDFADMIAPLERERGRFRAFCALVLVGGLAAGAIGSHVARRRSGEA
jgi:hypothetical protein